MSAEDYDDVPGLGGGGGWGGGRTFVPRAYTCNFCKQPIEFKSRKPFNKDGTPHRCMARGAAAGEQPASDQAMLFALGAMNAIISGQIQAGGINHIHQMNFYDVADAAWRISAAMVHAEKSHRGEFQTP